MWSVRTLLGRRVYTTAEPGACQGSACCRHSAAISVSVVAQIRCQHLVWAQCLPVPYQNGVLVSLPLGSYMLSVPIPPRPRALVSTVSIRIPVTTWYGSLPLTCMYCSICTMYIYVIRIHVHDVHVRNTCTRDAIRNVYVLIHVGSYM